MGFIDKIKNKYYEFKNRKNKDAKPTKFKVGIAFGGGGTRGFAHLGALKAFEEHGIDFDYVAGTSVGALVGALYAKGVSVDEMIDMAKSLRPKDLRTSKLPFVPSKTDKLEELLKEVIGDTVFSELKKPFSVIAVDMISAKEKEITSGSVIKAVAGSCALPAVFNPVEFDGMMLMDGGLTNTIPADIVRNKGCKYVISIDVNPARGYGTESFKLIDILATSVRIMMKQNAQNGKMYSDIVIEPDTKRFKASRTEGGLEMIEEGYLATIEKMDEIKALLKIKTKKKKIVEEVEEKTEEIEEIEEMPMEEVIEE